MATNLPSKPTCYTISVPQQPPQSAYQGQTNVTEEAFYEDTKTPTNETISILDGQVVADFESSSASSSGYGSYQLAGNIGCPLLGMDHIS